MSLNAIKSEDDFCVTARDGKDIFVRHAVPINDNDKAIILAHGITGHPNEYIHLAARDYFNAEGYDVYRMSFYDDADNARKLHTTTLPLQANDLNDVVASIKGKHSKTFLCGHSYGGATTLFANPDVDAITFWDSSFYVWQYWDNFSALNDNLINASNRISMLHNTDMKDHALAQTGSSMEALAGQIKAPSTVVSAEHGGLIEGCKKLYESLNIEKDYQQIARADHCFYNGHTAQDLFKKTHNWFERF